MPPSTCMPLIMAFPVSRSKVEKSPLAMATNIVPKNSQGLKWPYMVTVFYKHMKDICQRNDEPSPPGMMLPSRPPRTEKRNRMPLSRGVLFLIT